MKREAGFTLIELLVALFLITIIGVFTTQAIVQANNIKTKLLREGELYHGIQVSMALMERDIRHAYHRARQEEKKTPPDTTKPPEGEGGTGATPLPPPAEEDVKRSATDLWGTKQEIHFTMLGHRQIFEGIPESKFSEVGYFLKNSPEKDGLSILVRRESTVPDGDVRTGGEEQELADNVKALNFRYYNLGDEEWQERWDTSKLDFKDLFPEAVEITMTMVDERNREVTFTTIIQILLPNNPKKEEMSIGY